MVSPGKARLIAAWMLVNSAPVGATVYSEASAAGIQVIEMRVMITREQTRRCIGIIGSEFYIFVLLN
jgi:hypothetical protein